MQIPVFLPLGSMKEASLSVMLMEEGMKCGEDGSPLSELFCAANVSPQPTVNIYICHAGFPQGDSGTLVLSGSLDPCCWNHVYPQEESSGSAWQWWPGMSAGWILWVAEGRPS